MPTDVVEDVEVVRGLMPMYRVLVHNDDVNSMEHVVGVLQQVFKFEFQKCVDIMLGAHNTGAALCTIEPLEPAELHKEMLEACSLSASIEPE